MDPNVVIGASISSALLFISVCLCKIAKKPCKNSCDVSGNELVIKVGAEDGSGLQLQAKTKFKLKFGKFELGKTTRVIPEQTLKELNNGEATGVGKDNYDDKHNNYKIDVIEDKPNTVTDEEKIDIENNTYFEKLQEQRKQKKKKYVYF